MSVETQGVEVRGPVEGRYAEILTPEALGLIAALHREFDGRRRELLERRVERQAELDAGGTLDFLPETREVREGDWKIAPGAARRSRTGAWRSPGPPAARW